MPTPQLPGFGDVGAFIRWTKSIDYRINLLFEKLNNVLANTGLSVPGPGVTQVDGTFNVLGTENISGNLNVTGSETVSGNLTVSGALILPNASVSDAWLVKPVTPGVVNLYVSFFGLGSTSYAEIAGQDLTVPPNCTQLQFTGTAAIDCYNPKTTGGNNGAGGDYLYAQIRVGSNTSAGNWATGVSGNGGNATATRSYSDLITGLTPGATVRASVYGVSDYGIASASGNLASLSMQLTWLR